MTTRSKEATWPSARANRITTRTSETLAANRTVTLEEVETYQTLAFDPGGLARNVVLPAEENCDDVLLYISNTADAVEDITVQNDAAGTVCTISQNESAIVWCDGVRWYALVGGIT